MALPAGRKGVLPSELTPDGKIKNNGSSYTLPTASADTLGGVKVGSGLSIEDGVLSATGYTLPAASADTLGGVKVGSGLSIADGVLSVTGGGGGGLTIRKYEKSVDVALNASQVSGNYDDLLLSEVPANAVIISSKIVPTTGDVKYVQPLLSRNSDGSVHIGFWNTSTGTVMFTGKLVIYYYEEA